MLDGPCVMNGKTISHYRIVEKIGEGGMGIVYMAEDLRLKRRVAIKFLHQSALDSERGIERLIREARAAASLDHPNICPIYEIDECDGSTFIVMPCLDGETLRERMEKGPLSVDEALEIAIQIASGLKEAHEHSIVHRDIKPENIFLCKSGQVKIMDFGLAKTIESKGLTVPGLILGTVAYMSPEQAQGLEIDHRADLWSLGVILYECLTGKNPFESEYMQAILYSITNEDPESVAGLRDEVTEELEMVVEKLMAKRPEDRYQDAGEVIEDLKMVKESIEAGEPGTLSQKWKGVRRKYFYRGAILYAAVTAVIITAVVVVFVNHPRNALSFAKRDWLLITTVENMTGEEIFEKVLNEAISIDIQQSKWVNVFDRKRIERTLKRMRREGLERIDENLGLEICKREGIKAMLVPKITRIGNTYSLSAYIVDVATGNRLSPIRITVEGRDAVLRKAVDRLTRKIRKNLGESLLSIVRSDRSLPKVTTGSLEALEQFALGFEKSRRPVDWEEIKIYFENALSLDSTFAYAYAALGTICDNNMEYEEAKKYYTKAIKYIDNLTDRERYRILAEYYRIVENDPKKAIKSYRTLLDMYPDDVGAYNNIGYIYFRIGMYEEALNAFRQALRIEPKFILSLNNTATVALHMRNFNLAVETGRKIVELDRDYPMGYLSMGRGYNGMGMYNRAIEVLTKADSFSPDNHWVLLHLGRAYKGLGMYEEALRALKKSVKMNPKNYYSLADIAKTYALMGNREKALAVFDRLESIGNFGNRLYDEACVHALLGDTTEAMRVFKRAISEGLEYEYFRDYEDEVKLLRSVPGFEELVARLRERYGRI